MKRSVTDNISTEASPQIRNMKILIMTEEGISVMQILDLPSNTDQAKRRRMETQKKMVAYSANKHEAYTEGDAGGSIHANISQ